MHKIIGFRNSLSKLNMGAAKDQIKEQELEDILEDLIIMGKCEDGEITYIYKETTDPRVKKIIRKGIIAETLSEKANQWKHNFEKIKIELEKKIKEEYEEKERELKRSEKEELENFRKEKEQRIQKEILDQQEQKRMERWINEQKTRPKKRRETKCYNCNRPGHIALNCLTRVH